MSSGRTGVYFVGLSLGAVAEDLALEAASAWVHDERERV